MLHHRHSRMAVRASFHNSVRWDLGGGGGCNSAQNPQLKGTFQGLKRRTPTV